MDYTKQSIPELKKILERNPPDVPHSQKALSALQLGMRQKELHIQTWLLIFAGAGLILELLRLFLIR